MAGVRTATPALTPANSLAVLPFRSIARSPDDDASQDYFAEGMTEALITRLASPRNLRVVSLAADGAAGGGQKDDAA